MSEKYEKRILESTSILAEITTPAYSSKFQKLHSSLETGYVFIFVNDFPNIQFV